MTLVAALPMYDWPELRGETDQRWADMRDAYHLRGIDAPQSLARRNGDLPPVPGGIRDSSGAVIAADPASLPAEDFDLRTLWLHPNLLVSETCWGPMTLFLEPHVTVIGQSRYDGITGGQGEFYSSVIVARKADGSPAAQAPADGAAVLPLADLRGRRLAFNETRSLSGYLALQADLGAMGEAFSVFSERVETGSHRASVLAVADGSADIAAIDCKSWTLAQRYDAAAGELQVIGWTARRKGLPLVQARRLDLSAG